MQIIYKLKLCMIQYAKSVPILFRTDRNYIHVDKQLSESVLERRRLFFNKMCIFLIALKAVFC